MTPLIRYFSQFTPGGHWFDLGKLDKDHGFELDPERLCHLPYEQTMITFVDADGHWACIRASFTGETVAIAGLVVYQNKTQAIAPYAYVDTEEGLRLIPAPGYPLPAREDILRSLAVVDLLLSRLESPQVCYHRERKTTGLARIKKKPMLEWKVLRVEPRKSEPQPTEQGAGAHSSPRAHDRRGHWRSLPTGRKIWVKQCRVGDPDNGVVLKDYLVR